MSSIEMQKGGKFTHAVPVKPNLLFYVVKGEVHVNGVTAKMHELIEFDHNDETIEVEACEGTLLLFGYGEPFHEPIVAHGPFVMNSQEEISLSFADYQAGKIGKEDK